MMNGKVKSLKGGFGFLRMENGVDVFFLPTHVKDSTIRFDELEEGQAVEAEVDANNPRGPRATYVRILDSES